MALQPLFKWLAGIPGGSGAVISLAKQMAGRFQNVVMVPPVLAMSVAVEMVAPGRVVVPPEMGKKVEPFQDWGLESGRQVKKQGQGGQ
ncbi:MAG: hypothetical protein H6560_02285 [Lewinellaceae bacterium]|nr:hypothetical protein [Lewinellaceae bacterium]